jgi:hypothetical protein
MLFLHPNQPLYKKIAALACIPLSGARFAPSTDADNIRPIFKSRSRGVAGYYCRCPSEKSNILLFISAFFT